MSEQVPTVGRIVHYRLSDPDATLINVPQRVGNRARMGDTYPALVVRNNGGSVNLQVFLDGSDSYWATSRTEGEDGGHWSWPPRA